VDGGDWEGGKKEEKGISGSGIIELCATPREKGLPRKNVGGLGKQLLLREGSGYRIRPVAERERPREGEERVEILAER